MIQTLQAPLPVPYLPSALIGLRLVHITDLHYGSKTPNALIQEAVQATNDANPDIVAMTGDYVSANTDDPEHCADILAALRAPLGIFATLGNHDYSCSASKVVSALTRIGANVLVNQNYQVRDGLWIAGFDDDRHGTPDPEAAFSEIPHDGAVIALIHNPAYAENIHNRRYVGLSGHTHGGQILLPFFTARELRRIGAKRYRAGWYDIAGARVYVNQGVGYSGLAVRFRCPSEVTVFTLERAA